MVSRKAEALGIPAGSVARPIRKIPEALGRPQTRAIPDRDARSESPACVRFNQSTMLLQKQRTVCIKADVIQSSGLLSDSTVLDETWALTRASNKPLSAFALLWMSYSLSFGDSDSGHNNVCVCILLMLLFLENPD